MHRRNLNWYRNVVWETQTPWNCEQFFLNLESSVQSPLNYTIFTSLEKFLIKTLRNMLFTCKTLYLHMCFSLLYIWQTILLVKGIWNSWFHTSTHARRAHLQYIFTSVPPKTYKVSLNGYCLPPKVIRTITLLYLQYSLVKSERKKHLDAGTISA
jgi:hypothetical protein